MRLHPAFIAVPMVAVISCWFAVRAQQQPQTQPPADRVYIQPASLQPEEVVAIAGEMTRRAERFKPLFEQVNAAAWVAKGAPEVYVAQWNSLSQQNAAIENDMAGITEHPDAMSHVMKSLFRLHRFDTDLPGLLNAVRRYQTSSLADLIESVASSDLRGIEKLQQYALDLAGQKEQLLDIEDKEAQRCRSALATQMPARSAAPAKTNKSPK